MRAPTTFPTQSPKNRCRLTVHRDGPLSGGPSRRSHAARRPAGRAPLGGLLAAVLDASPIGVRIDRLETCLYANPAFSRLFGPQATAPAPQLWGGLVTADDTDEMMRSQRAWLSGQEAPSPYEASFRMAGGRLAHVAAWPTVIDHLGEPAILTFVVDATAEKALRSQLLQAQKMEAIGTLAGGVAHDFNNIIQAVKGNAEFLLLEGAARGQECAELEEIVRVTERATELTRRLLTFSRQIDSVCRPIDLNREVRDCCRLLSRTLSKMITVDLHVAPGRLIVDADPLQVEQVVMNLAVNARDAMPEGGRLRIATSTTTLDEAYCRTRPGLRPGRYARLTVTDTGSGMTAETMEHIFEPFYTTKPAGQGTGLGLAIVYGIVRKHGGYLECTSEMGAGAEFRVYLPRTTASVASTEATREPAPLPQGGCETVLFVDDEAGVRGIGARVLQRAGYTVLPAADGETALRLFDQHRDRVGLVMLDLQMPGIGGRRCLERLRALGSNVPVVVTTGGMPDAETESAIEAMAQFTMKKPYGVRALLDTVRTVLDGHLAPSRPRKEPS